MKVTFAERGLEDYIYWQEEDKKILIRINQLLKDIQRNGLMTGIGKPEFLKHKKVYSRRIDDVNRLVYIGIDKNSFEVISCKGHYDDK